ncbi:hypothetical protein [Tenacibaculum bernardetii]|uniref:hypothetical protein n=1 Tax=Tenacibaculum bernardetii TaxID=3021375 RepID=UPI0023AFF146|nr:hypothetical protein [Tenacibaculum bernardetii]
MKQIKTREIEVFIRDVINNGKTCIDWDKLEKENKTFLTKVKELFKFENDNSWKFLTSSLDVIGDSQFAINKFLESKNIQVKDNGEAYLMIYGVFSAVYIQYKSIKTIAKIVKLKNEKKLYKDFEKLDIIFLRHIVSAHPIDFKNNGNSLESYKLDRGSVKDFNYLTVINEVNEFKQYNIFNCIEKFNELTNFYLKLVAEKIIENRYSKGSIKTKNLVSKLNMI